MTSGKTRCDKRVVSTKAAAKAALTELMAEKGLENIAITGLCKRAGINRGTFYNHWKSIDELLTECEDAVLDQLCACLGAFAQLDRTTAQDYIRSREPLPSIVDVFRFLGENAAFLAAVLGPNGDRSYDLRLRDRFSQEFLDVVVRARFTYESESDAEYFAWYASSGFLGLVGTWLRHGCQEPPEEMAVKLMALLPTPVSQINL